ncbi:MAG: MotA/TolQ/ExbB proton channel family protein [Bacteroidetes bacterium]|nr:MotA/TolQ/ExbB proton channel family protein [Bacteroidota bacterium]
MLNFILQSSATIATTAIADSIHQVPAVSGIQMAEAATETKISLISMVLKGGPIMYPLVILLIVSIYVLVERLIVTSKAARKTPGLTKSLQDFINQGNINNARNLCKTTNTPESLMLEQGVSRIGQPIQEIREALNKGGANEIAKLEKHLNVLNIIGRIAPMFGFIGTIFGVVKIFYDISLAKTVEIGVISEGLYQKMISSAGGLVVGVFAFVCYHWLNSRLDKLAHRMEDTQIEFLDMLNEPSK